MSLFINSVLTLKFVFKVIAVNRENGSYHSYVKKVAVNEIRKSHDLNDGSISKLDFLKIQWYMVTTLYLGELLTELRPNKLTKQEKKSLIYLGALIAITDLMVDDHQLTSEKLTELLSGNSFDHKHLSPIERVFILYHHKLISNLSVEKAVIIQDFAFRKPQIESQSQLKSDLTEEEVIENTTKKGGAALVLIASLLFDTTEPNEAAIYQLGVFIQYLNDSQDIYKDIKAGITTFVSYRTTFNEINKTLSEEFSKTIESFTKTNYSVKGVCHLLFYINALFTGVSYKVESYSKIAGEIIDIEKIRQMDKSIFNTNMLSLKSVEYCIPKIITFKKASE